MAFVNSSISCGHPQTRPCLCFVISAEPRCKDPLVGQHHVASSPCSSGNALKGRTHMTPVSILPHTQYF